MPIGRWWPRRHGHEDSLSGTVDHGVLDGLSDDDHPHYLTQARHSAVNHDNEIVNHAGLEGVSADQHHAKSHAHDGADGSGTVAHSAITGVTANQHHNEDHAARHRSGGADELVKAARVTTGSVAGLSLATVTVTWGSAFADANYTPVVSMLEDAAGTGLIIRRIRTVTDAAITVLVENTNAMARTGTLQALAVHD